ncbi:hypothetical protein LTS10_005275 [Elasticomyces elasticus]|nr:hypothetical protein LTS10_005275 [Elasticomyces elasticus]
MAATTVLSKRKRAQVSYLDQNDELDELLDIQEPFADIVDDESDDDLTFGSHKNPQAIKKRKAAKRAKASKSSTKSKKNEKPFPFERLPPELRDQIYELALTNDDGITLVSKTHNYRRTVGPGPIANDDGSWLSLNHRQRRALQQSQSQSQGADGPPTRKVLSPALLAVSKQLHAEGINYLYQQTIILEDTYALHSFLGVIGRNRSRVTDLTIKGWGNGRGTHKAMNFCSLTLLAGCTNLQFLEFDCSIHWRSSATLLARQLYRDGYHFLEAYGAANGARDAAVEILELRDLKIDAKRPWNYRGSSESDNDKFNEEFQAELRKLLGCKK